ncbi:response regulator [Geomonas subterranea]|uniref:histidine kinase n=1 Tax=Geomonas subterranea TaxID=2847989 RepID=A0ABX8LM68_9BACT|nr:response regulator [Geomonas subterranea]QXE91810.1 response regulator [Geomonas subterranea]QXM10097.1 response regulator [Geomonas subterranea]
MPTARERVTSILYVEDEAEARELIGNLLSEEHRHLRIIIAADGAEGLTLFKEHRPQIVVTDIRMPVMDGLTMAGHIRDMDQEVDLIALSAYSDTSFLVRAIELGFSNYVFKPVNFSKLLTALNRIIKVRELKHRFSEQNELLRISEQRLQATFDQAAVGIGHVAMDGSFLRINDKYCAIAGCNTGSVPGTIYDFTHPEDLPGCRTHHELLLEGKQRSYSLEKRYVHNEITLWASLTVSMVQDRSGKDSFMVAIVDDITQRKILEQEIAELNRALSVRAEELEDANRDLTAFNYTVAHDLRQPLNLISGYCQAVSMTCGKMLNEDCREFLQKAFEGTVKMNKLVNALLEFAEMAHAEPKQETVDLSREAEELAAELARSEPKRQARFIIAPGLSARGDSQLLRAVLANLLGNAWKYTTERTETLIEFGSTMREGEAVFYVSDNGIGFDMAQTKEIFVPFRRLPGAQRSGGFGIGLATVERIIKRHGGRVWAEGEQGKGATFYFSLC